MIPHDGSNFPNDQCAVIHQLGAGAYPGKDTAGRQQHWEIVTIRGVCHCPQATRRAHYCAKIAGLNNIIISIFKFKHTTGTANTQYKR